MLFDVFNGDADGLCALQQFRLATPASATLVTGVKRDISLLKRIQASAGDEVAVFDISLDKNREALQRLLEQGVRVRYFDHHFAGEIPEHDNMESYIDVAAETCTSLIVNGYLKGRFCAWAVVGAFGDNLDTSARRAAADLKLSEAQLASLCELGICLNYNGYGAALDDLFFTPQQLAERMRPHLSPFDFMAAEPELFATLQNGAEQDTARARAVAPAVASDNVAVFLFPAEPWARRVSGVFSNELATAHPNRAHALLTALPQGGFVASVRAPLNNKQGADELCRAFATGGGRKAAAGINELPESQYTTFVNAFQTMYG